MDIRLKNNIFIIAALALIASGIFAALAQFTVPGPDSIQYDRLGLNIVSGHGLSMSEAMPFMPTMFREPGYPVFLASIYALFGHNTLVVLFVQMLLHLATAVLIYHIATGIFIKKAAFMCGICVAVFPTLANASAYILSETLFTFLLCLGIYMYSKGVNTGKAHVFTLAGIVFAALTLTRAAAMFLPFTLVILAVIIGIARKSDMKRLFTGLLLFTLIFSMAVSGWMLRNKYHFNTFAITLRGGEALWSRAEKLDDTPKGALTDACYNFSEFLGAKFFPGVANKPERYLFRDFEKAEALRAEYARLGMTDPQIEEIFKKEAIAKIKEKPLKYAAYTFIEWIKMASFTYLPVLNEDVVKTFFNTIKHGVVILSALRAVMRILAYLLLTLFIISVIKNLKIWDRWIALFVTIAYFNIIYSLLDAIGRYGIPLIPFYCIMAIGLVWLPQDRDGKGAIL